MTACAMTPKLHSRLELDVFDDGRSVMALANTSHGHRSPKRIVISATWDASPKDTGTWSTSTSMVLIFSPPCLDNGT